MKRFRWVVLLLAVMGAAAGASSAVFAGSTAQTATYWNHAIVGSSPSAGVWLAYNNTATWTFDVYELQTAMPGSVSLNFAGLSKNIHEGSGFSTSLKVVVSGGASSGTFTATLANPWRPHVAYNASPGIGWQASGSLTLPNYVWKNAAVLTVKVTSLTTNTYWSMADEGLMLGYATAE